MARRLSVRYRDGAYEVGPAGNGRGPTTMVSAPNRRTALHEGKRLLREIDADPSSDGRSGFAMAVANSYRFGEKIDTRC